ncbi:MAG: hypothetical protein ABIP54_04735 [Candidatus Andersenbacteria bacterium]
MSLSTFSAFYFGHTINGSNSSIDFDEGGGELQATLNIGNYTLTEFGIEIKRALDSAGLLTYTVTIDRDTRVISISSTSNFSLLVTSGTRVGTGAWDLMGFTGADRTGGMLYAGNLGSGSEYLPQALLEEHIASENYEEKQDAVVNTSASGKVEVITFGTVNYVQFNIKYANSLSVVNRTIEIQASGLTNLRTFMQYIITKAKFEYIPNRGARSIFQNVLLESTAADKKGTAFKLKELKNAPGYFETEKMLCRVVTS